MPLPIGDIIKPVTNAASSVTGTLSEAWAAVIGDRVAVWRLNNIMKHQPKIFENARKYGLSLNTAKIPDRYAFAWFEEASKQDEDEIQELFARLLAQAAAGNEDATDRRHIEVVSRLTPDDAVVMDHVFKQLAAKRHEAHEQMRLSPTSIPMRWGTVELDEYELFTQVKDSLKRNGQLAIDHLVVLGVLNRSRRGNGVGEYGHMTVYLSTTGVSLFEAMGGIQA